MQCPRLIVAAPMSGSGKTTITAGLIAALVERGLRVAPFKVGPDYIDPTYHSLAANQPCSNLDPWMLPPEQVRALLAYRAQAADIACIEGAMGLFDGRSGQDDSGSTAHVARITSTPVLLVLDIRSMARSAAALVKGLYEFDPRVRIAGVILNRAGSLRHARMVSDAIESSVGVPVVGYLLRDEALHLPERHLGLIPTHEPGRWNAWIAEVRERIAASVDLDQVLEWAGAAPPLSEAANPFVPRASCGPVVIAVARDAAFNFLYEDNLALLRAAGANIVFFSPLHDQALPPTTQALYLCGGFPEMYAAALAQNTALRADIRAAFHDGLPIYAECGGLMYLTEEIVDTHNQRRDMVGLLPGRSIMTKRLTLGYRTMSALGDNWLLRDGEMVRGHEFHYSIWQDRPVEAPPMYRVVPDESPHNHLSDHEGAQMGNLLASYVHLHFLAYPQLADRMVSAAHARQPWRG